MRKFSFKLKTRSAVLKPDSSYPKEVIFDLLGQNFIIFSNENKEKAGCLNCLNHPCISFSANELKTTILPGMPFNNQLNVCPTDSIKFNSEGFPYVIEDLCIGCGFCLSRCQYGAINLNNDYKAKITYLESRFYDWEENISMEYFAQRNNQIQVAKQTVLEKPLAKEHLLYLYRNILKLNKASNGFENLIVRNLLLMLGIKNKIRAIGNNDIRFDLIGEYNGTVILGEIGLNGTDILEEPRAILDDFSILNSRYNIGMEKIRALIITLTFPNKRSDIYEVIFDINNVLGIRIHTISLNFLFVLNFFRLKIDAPTLFQNFHVDNTKTEIQSDAICFIKNLERIDPLFNTSFYYAIK